MSEARGVHSRFVKSTTRRSSERKSALDSKSLSTRGSSVRNTSKSSNKNQTSSVRSHSRVKDQDKLDQRLGEYLQEKNKTKSSITEDRPPWSMVPTKRLTRREVPDLSSYTKQSSAHRNASNKNIPRKTIPKIDDSLDTDEINTSDTAYSRNTSSTRRDSFSLSSSSTDSDIVPKEYRSRVYSDESYNRSIERVQNKLLLSSSETDPEYAQSKAIYRETKLKNIRQQKKLSTMFEDTDSDIDIDILKEQTAIKKFPTNAVVNAARQMRINRELLGMSDSTDDFRKPSSPQQQTPSISSIMTSPKRSARPATEIMEEFKSPTSPKQKKLQISPSLYHQAAETLLAEQRELDDLRTLVSELRRLQNLKEKVTNESHEKVTEIEREKVKVKENEEQWTLLDSSDSSSAPIPKHVPLTPLQIYEEEEQEEEDAEDTDELAKRASKPQLMIPSSPKSLQKPQNSFTKTEESTQNRKETSSILDNDYDTESMSVPPPELFDRKEYTLPSVSDTSSTSTMMDSETTSTKAETETEVEVAPLSPHKDGTLLERIHDHLIHSPYSPTKSPPPPNIFSSESDVGQKGVPPMSPPQKGRPLLDSDEFQSPARKQSATKKRLLDLELSLDDSASNKEMPKLQLKPDDSDVVEPSSSSVAISSGIDKGTDIHELAKRYSLLASSSSDSENSVDDDNYSDEMDKTPESPKDEKMTQTHFSSAADYSSSSSVLSKKSMPKPKPKRKIQVNISDSSGDYTLRERREMPKPKPRPKAPSPVKTESDSESGDEVTRLHALLNRYSSENAKDKAKKNSIDISDGIRVEWEETDPLAAISDNMSDVIEAEGRFARSQPLSPPKRVFTLNFDSSSEEAPMEPLVRVKAAVPGSPPRSRWALSSSGDSSSEDNASEKGMKPGKSGTAPAPPPGSESESESEDEEFVEEAPVFFVSRAQRMPPLALSPGQYADEEEEEEEEDGTDRPIPRPGTAEYEEWLRGADSVSSDDLDEELRRLNVNLK